MGEHAWDVMTTGPGHEAVSMPKSEQLPDRWPPAGEVSDST